MPSKLRPNPNKNSSSSSLDKKGQLGNQNLSYANKKGLYPYTGTDLVGKHRPVAKEALDNTKALLDLYGQHNLQSAKDMFAALEPYKSADRAFEMEKFDADAKTRMNLADTEANANMYQAGVQANSALAEKQLDHFSNNTNTLANYYTSRRS